MPTKTSVFPHLPLVMLNLSWRQFFPCFWDEFIVDNVFLECLSVGLDTIHVQAGVYALWLGATSLVVFRAGYRLRMAVIVRLHIIPQMRCIDSETMILYMRFRPSSSFPLFL